MTNLLGKVLSNRYKILEKVGAGGMALVYKAKDMLLGRLVAVKVLREQYAGDREFVERFRREAQAAASLSHANVVNIYDVGQEDDVYFIVMEYVEGRNLKDIIRRQSIPLGTAVHIAQQVAMALEHAHRHHLVHRDIKPHNIIITEDNQVKVTDFGIALAASYSELTQTGFVMGTAQYFSPEQARGGMATKQSDLYSLGVLLYEMLTGTLPFTGGYAGSHRPATRTGADQTSSAAESQYSAGTRQNRCQGVGQGSQGALSDCFRDAARSAKGGRILDHYWQTPGNGVTGSGGHYLD